MVPQSLLAGWLWLFFSPNSESPQLPPQPACLAYTQTVLEHPPSMFFASSRGFTSRPHTWASLPAPAQHGPFSLLPPSPRVPDPSKPSHGGDSTLGFV